MNRRGFLSGILALGAAPAIVRADSLMRIVPIDMGVELEWMPGWAMWNSSVVLNEHWMVMAQQTGARMALIREMVRYNVLRSA